MTNETSETWTFPQRIRVAADVLREVAAYRDPIAAGTINEHSNHTPYDAACLDNIAAGIENEQARTVESLAATMYQAITRRSWSSANQYDRLGHLAAAEAAIDEGWHQ